jgi:hypothetical protein
VTRIDAAVLRVDLPATGSRALGPVPLGTPLVARVESPLGGGRWLIDLAGLRLQAETALSLVAGDLLEVVASRNGEAVELRLLRSAVRFDEVRYAAATLAQAGARAGSVSTLPAPGDLARLIDAALAGDAIPPAERPALIGLAKALAAFSAPLTRDTDLNATASFVRRLLEDAGLLFEARVRAALAEAPAASAEHAPLPDVVQRDARVLLASLATRLAAHAPAAARAPNEQATGAAPADVDDAVPAALSDRIGEALLERQLNLAGEWLESGRLTIGLPLVIGSDTRLAELRIDTDASRKSRDGEPRAFAFEVRVELPELGRLDALVRWAGREVSARIIVDQEELEPLVRAELSPLAAALRRAGFEHVTTDVVVDPLRLARNTEPAPSVPHGGRIIDARV